MMKQRIAILLSIASCVASCASESDECADFIEKFDGSYSGVVIALETGQLSFAANPNCRIAFSGNPEFENSVREAWLQSNYAGHFRPIYIEVKGDLIDRHDQTIPELGDIKVAPLIKVQQVIEIEPATNQGMIEQQYEWTFGRNYELELR